MGAKHEQIPGDRMRYQAVVLDIEGTTTAITFVHDTLFPYAREHMGAFLAEHWAEPEIQADLEQVWQQAQADRAEGLSAPPVPASGAIEALQRAVLANLLWQMDEDRKTTGLKSLQGRIWQAGYEDGTLRAHLFDDVPEAMHRWHQAGLPIYIYSSGSVPAQKLLFGHTIAGDLLPLLSGYFDTRTGPKKEADSYRAISQIIEKAPGDILFVTDNIDEAQAADAAGLQVAVSVRPGNAPLPEGVSLPTIQSFSELL